MAFNLLAEFPQSPDWAAVHARAASLQHVQVFPILPAALGISVPLPSATERGWQELRAFLLALLVTHAATVVELYGGTSVTPEAIDRLRPAITDTERAPEPHQ